MDIFPNTSPLGNINHVSILENSKEFPPFHTHICLYVWLLIAFEYCASNQQCNITCNCRCKLSQQSDNRMERELKEQNSPPRKQKSNWNLCCLSARFRLDCNFHKGFSSFDLLMRIRFVSSTIVSCSAQVQHPFPILLPPLPNPKWWIIMVIYFHCVWKCSRAVW